MADEYAEALIHQMVDPNNNGELIRWFSKGQKSGIWKTENVFVPNDTGVVANPDNLYGFANFSSLTVCRPSAIGGIHSTLGSGTFIQLQPLALQAAANPAIEQHLVIDNLVNQVYFSNPIFLNDECVYPVPINGIPSYAVNMEGISPAAGTSSTANNNTLFVTCITNGTASYREVSFGVNALNYNTGVEFSVFNAFGANYYGINGELLPNNPNVATCRYVSTTTETLGCYYLQFYLQGLSHFHATLDATVVLSNEGFIAGSTTMSCRFPNVPAHCSVSNLYQIETLLPLINDGFVVSQSMLCSYEGSTLNDAGLISTAYLNPDYWPGQYAKNPNSFYYYLASLNHDNYDGPLRHGSYCWWSPQDTRDMEASNVVNVNWNKPFMAAAWVAGYAGETVRVRITTVYQYFSENNMFSYSLGGCMKETTPQFLYTLGNVPHCSANGTHLELIKKWMKKVGTMAFTTLKNPNFWSGAADVAGTIASFL